MKFFSASSTLENPRRRFREENPDFHFSKSGKPAKFPEFSIFSVFGGGRLRIVPGRPAGDGLEKDIGPAPGPEEGDQGAEGAGIGGQPAILGQLQIPLAQVLLTDGVLLHLSILTSSSYVDILHIDA